MKFGRKLRSMGDGLYGFHCPGCNEIHMVNTDASDRPAWGFNDNGDAPTFTPSILVRAAVYDPPVTAENLDEWERAPWPQTAVVKVCHSFVTDGRIQFLGDCTHAMAGQTIDLPDIKGD